MLGCDGRCGQADGTGGLQRFLKGARASKPVLRSLGESLRHHGIERRDAGVQGRRFLVDVLVDERDGVAADERGPPGQQLVEQAPGGVEVAARAGDLTERLFGGEVGRGPQEGLGQGQGRGRVVMGTGDPEVHDLDRTGGCDDHVGRLDVAVDDACSVTEVQRLEDLGLVVDRLAQGDRAGLEEITQRPSDDVLHRDEGHADRACGVRVDLLQAGVEDGYDRWVVEPGSHRGLASEARPDGGIPGEVPAQHLDGDRAAQPQVPSEMDIGGGAGADDIAHLVPPEQDARQAHRRGSQRK